MRPARSDDVPPRGPSKRKCGGKITAHAIGAQAHKASAALGRSKLSLVFLIGVLGLEPRAAEAVEMRNFVAFWKDDFMTCGAAMLDPVRHHKAPAESLGITAPTIDARIRAQDGKIMDFAGDQQSAGANQSGSTGLVSAPADTTIEQSCQVILAYGAGDLATATNTGLGAFNGSLLKLGGQPVDARTGTARSGGTLGSVEYVLEGAFPGRNLVPIVPSATGALSFEHIVVLPPS